MKKLIKKVSIACLCILLFTACNKNTGPEPSATELNYPPHPRILLLKGEESKIRDLIDSNPTWKEMHFAILERANNILGKSLLERKMTGRRLLSISREFLKREFYLAYAYRLTLDDRFLQRAEQEMLNVAQFSDWNPDHFLDVAEMTMGMAIGYDWLYDQLSDDAKASIRTAIMTKGLEPSYDSDHNWFLRSNNNWNQVCNAGMTFGALAIAEDEPLMAEVTIDRAIETIELPMEEYQHNGAYPEGYAYWGYGTTTNVLFLDAIEKTLGDDHGLSNMPGFLQTGEFLTHMLGTSSVCYNWGDCSLGGSLKPAMFWFAKKNNNPSLLYMENKFLQEGNFSQYTWNRMLPAIMIWAKDIPLEDITEPTATMYVGQGASPVALMRTSWSNPNAIYLGFKSGTPAANHGHMDIGSFIMEADGIRWASDFGSQNYESLESKGLSIFGRTQDAQRWTIFRYNNLAHNTLTINGEHQRVDGYAKIDRYGEADAFPFAISDISSVYDGQLQAAKRGVGIVQEQYVIIRDEVITLDEPATIRWTMLTTANVTLNEGGATLTKDGKKLLLQVKGPDNLQMKIWSTEPTTDYDAPNPGTKLIGFECELPANRTEAFQVLLIPEQALGAVQDFDKHLVDW